MHSEAVHSPASRHHPYGVGALCRSQVRFFHALPFLLCLLVLALSPHVLAQRAPEALEGVWRTNTGGIQRITQEGPLVYSVHLELLPAGITEFGYMPGDRAWYGTLADDTIVGSIFLRFPLSFREVCPDQWTLTSELELTVSESNDLLTGRWRQYYLLEDCVLERGPWQAMELRRVQSGQLSVVTHRLEEGQALGPTPPVQFIFDASNSMWAPVDPALGPNSPRRIDVAKEVMNDIIMNLPDDIRVALRLYGHRVPPGEPGACQDTELVMPLQDIDKVRLTGIIDGVVPRGSTPLVFSLQQVPNDFGTAPGEKRVVLITDGIEACGGDLTAAVQGLMDAGFELQLHIIGFGLETEVDTGELEHVTTITGGGYYDAQSAEELLEALEQSLAVPFDVFDTTGTRVRFGAVDQTVLELPAGTYTVVVRPTGTPITVGNVRVREGEQVVIELENVGDGIRPRVVNVGTND
jgi:hypothetical protein